MSAPGREEAVAVAAAAMTKFFNGGDWTDVAEPVVAAVYPLIVEVLAAAAGSSVPAPTAEETQT